MTARSHMKYRNKIILLTIVTLLLLLYCSQEASKPLPLPGPQEARPTNWAVPLEREGLSNFYKVSDDLYRGAQPKTAGFEELKKLGIKTIVNLRGSNADEKMIAGAGFNYFHIPISSIFPRKKKFARFLEIVSDPANCPVFVHCRRGADRTGTAVALYRINIQKWEKEEAINEMVNGGYHFNPIYFNLKYLVRHFK